jgi:predicted phosphodiesterase
VKVFAVSDLHLDYGVNLRWMQQLSLEDYRDDVLILAGDLSGSISLLEAGLKLAARRFGRVLYVPGNHDVWIDPDEGPHTSLEKFEYIRRIAEQNDVGLTSWHAGSLSIIPLLSWYDYSFGQPDADLSRRWRDFHACRWPVSFREREVTEYFTSLNEPLLGTQNTTVISFSHFLPRIDLMPTDAPAQTRKLYPVFGTTRLEEQIRRLQPHLHVYGHSHWNRRVTLDGITYVNNAFGYPRETATTAKCLRCVYEA